jgi:[ribosomal protein S18]-alanine N-acetyltransferase
MRVRAATPADEKPVTVLERELFGVDAWSPATVVSELTGEDRCAVVAEDGTGMVGYAVASTSGDVVDLHRIGVRPSTQRHGVGRSLLAAVLDRVDADRMLLEVGVDNTAALGFYAAAGFAEIDRRRRYYRDGTDAVVLSRPLARKGTDHA